MLRGDIVFVRCICSCCAKWLANQFQRMHAVSLFQGNPISVKWLLLPVTESAQQKHVHHGVPVTKSKKTVLVFNVVASTNIGLSSSLRWHVMKSVTRSQIQIRDTRHEYQNIGHQL